jgi:hypothetical protein
LRARTAGSRIERSTDPLGREQFLLDGVPLRALEMLELHLPDGRWTYVTFQLQRSGPVLNLLIASREMRFVVRLASELGERAVNVPGDHYVLYDRRAERPLLEGHDDDVALDAGGYQWKDRRQAEQAADRLNSFYLLLPEVQIRPIELCELRRASPFR